MGANRIAVRVVSTAWMKDGCSKNILIRVGGRATDEGTQINVDMRRADV